MFKIHNLIYIFSFTHVNYIIQLLLSDIFFLQYTINVLLVSLVNIKIALI